MDLVVSDGTRLFIHVWGPDRPPRASMLILHGVGEHGGRYSGLARPLAERGIRVVAFDQRGHGRSGGPRVHVDRWERYLEDGRAAIERAGADAPGIPLFVLGHSMGSLIALLLAAEAADDASSSASAVRGWIVSGAGIEPRGIAKPHLVAIAKLLSRIAPRVTLDLGIDAAALSHDPAVVAAYRDDDLVERRATVRWGAEALGAVREAKARASAVGAPLLILHGGADPLSDPQGSRWLADAVAGDATLEIYPQALHEPHNDPGYADAAADIIAWIEARPGGVARV